MLYVWGEEGSLGGMLSKGLQEKLTFELTVEIKRVSQEARGLCLGK